jgi:glycerophosphoryl diester phosphodiesterase
MSPLNIAHRGGAGLWPENTLAAFANAAAMGADGAELDVQLSRDGELVVFHDFRLKADLVSDGQGTWLTAPGPRIVDLSFAQLQGYDVVGRGRTATTHARILCSRPTKVNESRVSPMSWRLHAAHRNRSTFSSS